MTTGSRTTDGKPGTPKQASRNTAGRSKDPGKPGVITLEFTETELKLLTGLAADQLFRREFIDPKMPGYKTDPAELRMAKSLVSRLQSVVEGGHPEHAHAGGSGVPKAAFRVGRVGAPDAV